MDAFCWKLKSLERDISDVARLDSCTTSQRHREKLFYGDYYLNIFAYCQEYLIQHTISHSIWIHIIWIVTIQICITWSVSIQSACLNFALIQFLVMRYTQIQSVSIQSVCLQFVYIQSVFLHSVSVQSVSIQSVSKFIQSDEFISLSLFCSSLLA